jgi:hypothetical protein
MQWLQDTNQSHADNHNIVKHETIKNFRSKKRKYLKANINGLVTNSRKKNTIDLHRCINDCNGLPS